MAVSWTRRGRFRLSRDGVLISEHNDVNEAYENAFEHAEEAGAGTYRVDPPFVEIDVPATTILAGPRTPVPPAPVTQPPVDPPVDPPADPGALLFFDDFDYVVGPTDSGASKEAAFAAAGWSDIKDETTNPGQARGYISTVSSIPGYGGTIPTASGRMLRMNALPTTLAGQTDFFLQLGNGTAGNIPANVWIQHWMYINRSGSEQTTFLNIRNKWLYPLFGNNNGYPMATPDTAWLCNIGNTRYQGSQAIIAPADGVLTFRCHGEPNSLAQARANTPDQVSQGSGQQMTSRDLAAENDHWLFPNTMYLVRYNFDVSTNPGKIKIWWREAGQQAQGFGNPRVNFEEGVAPTGFTYDTYALDQLGAKFLRWPTTCGTVAGAGGDWWIYSGDFAMASSAAGLPVYSSI